jgi:hypothetical protein
MEVKREAAERQAEINRNVAKIDAPSVTRKWPK